MAQKHTLFRSQYNQARALPTAIAHKAEIMPNIGRVLYHPDTLTPPRR